ncbi:hypothetical protein PRUPE_4G203000 [Prunus persica]|uniref:Uncharacterized protein n=1 Tax=Prunus persica TaxID=3760 RepID=A0A251PNE9_PRUPE|nr:hypothetical protein PRUPE_4G203000 [Prunus persica]
MSSQSSSVTTLPLPKSLILLFSAKSLSLNSIWHSLSDSTPPPPIFAHETAFLNSRSKISSTSSGHVNKQAQEHGVWPFWVAGVVVGLEGGGGWWGLGGVVGRG